MSISPATVLAPKDGGRSTMRESSFPVALSGQVSITAASLSFTLGRASVRITALSILAASPRITIFTIGLGGDRNQCCIYFRIGIGKEKKDRMWLSGVTQISTASNSF